MLEEITKEQYEKFSDKYTRQCGQISDELSNNTKINSNLEKTVDKEIKIAENLIQGQVSSSFENMQKITVRALT